MRLAEEQRENCSKPPQVKLLFARTLKAHLKTVKSSRFRALRKTLFFPSFLLNDCVFFFCRCCCSVVVESSSSSSAAAHYPKLQEKDDDDDENNNKKTKSDEDDNDIYNGRPWNLQSSGVERGGVSAVRDRDRTSRKRVPEKKQFE